MLRVAAVLAGLALLTACGGGSAPAAPAAGSAAASPTPSPSPSVDEQALAAKINLRAADLPGYKPAAKGERGAARSADNRVECYAAGERATVATGAFNFSSEIFDDDTGDDLETVVTFVSDVAAVARDTAALRSARGQTCLPDLAVTLAEHGGGKLVSKPAVTPLKVEAPGLPQAFGYRVRLRYRDKGGTYTLVQDLVVLARGRTEVELTGFTSAGVSSTQLDRLVAVLAKRMAANAV